MGVLTADVKGALLPAAAGWKATCRPTS